jgi:hypothetical protein
VGLLIDCGRWLAALASDVLIAGAQIPPNDDVFASTRAGEVAEPEYHVEVLP